MVVAGAPVGVLGIHGTPALSQGERKALGAATALLAISVRNLQLFMKIRDLSLPDGLTGCFNRRHAIEALEAVGARRSGRRHAGVGWHYGRPCGSQRQSPAHASI
jgi:hypothetical protein